MLRQTLAINLIIIITADQKGTPNLPVVCEENMIWTAHIALQLLRRHPKDRPSYCLGLKADGSCIQESHRICQKKIVFSGHSYGCFPRDQSRRNKQKCPYPSLFLQRIWLYILWTVPKFLEKEMATHSSILAWKIPWTEEHGVLQSTGLQRVGHDWATSLH